MWFYTEQTTKFIVFSYAIVIIAGLYAIRSLYAQQGLTIRFNLINGLLLVLLIYTTINRYLFQPAYGFTLRYYEMLGLALLYGILRQMDARYYPYVFLAVILSGSIQAMYGNLQLYGDNPSHIAILK